jgi:Ser/Thr protein kinase RdoA (MazF antagonist)
MNTEVNELTVAASLAEHYGIEGVLRRLPGENLNYLVETGTGQRYVVKIVDDDMPPEVVEMEFKAIEHAESVGFPLQLPRILKNRHGNIETGIKLPLNSLKRLRLLSFINGTLLADISDISDELLKNVGISLARYNLAMQGFEHPAAQRNHRWNLARAGQHRDKISLLEDAVKQELLTWAFKRWTETESILPSLPQQFIHGDANPENILVTGGQVSGLVDFGDSCINPTVCDLAICLCYVMMERENPREIAEMMIGSYHGERGLSSLERSVIYPLIYGRLATSLVISNSRRAIDPHNPNWFDGEASAWNLLLTLKDLDL